ncbi:MAG: phenylalanine--tRNA ligase subunit beta [Verrucomicrobiota bacterium]|nr:phenylalanine--tRNA ligase subunit beta [Verrucomicrobiota bacterium]
MKFSVNWLREFVELPAGVDALAQLLTLAGIEIEGVEERGANFDKVVVAQIIASSPHPNADRLTVCQVDDGSGKPRQIVCGAKNYKVGDKVPLAFPGAVLPNDLNIRANKLRGVESEGMLCSAKELALSEEGVGLLILSGDAKVGAPIGTVFPTDTILDVEITPNRGDLLSHFGLAREIAALMDVAASVSEGGNGPPPGTATDTTVKITALRECPFYSARCIDNIVAGPTPDWIRIRIELLGIRSINNIVDITNYVMLELGQPLHAFDADKLQGGINVRLANPNEKFLALDGKTYSLGKDDLVIADEARAVAIAGVMGGEETGVTGSTRNLLLESAYFLPASVRRTARKLNLLSDASYRFERGVDPGMILRASAHASQLIREFASGNPAPKIATAGSPPPPPPPVRFRYKRCNQLLGRAIQPKTVDQILERFGLQKSDGKTDETLWTIPSHRSDLRREVDLIEEIVRVDGIDQIPSRDRSRFTPMSDADHVFNVEAKIRERLVARGISEVRTSALIPRSSVGNAFRESALELRNPLSEDHVALRPSLLPGLLTVVARNIRTSAESIRLFELGRIFQPTSGNEERRLAIVFCGKIEASPHWRVATKHKLDFFDVKGAIEAIAQAPLSFRRTKHPDLALAAEVCASEKTIGFIGQLTAERASALDTSSPVLIAEIELDVLLQLSRQTKTFHELEKFPSVRRDIAMIIPETLTHAEILAVIESAKEPLLERVELFDLFSGKQAESFGAGRKSLAYTLTYRNKNRTLTSDEVTEVHTKVRERLHRELPVELRE